MKRVLITIILLNFYQLTLSQSLPTIKAKDASFYAGKEVVLEDTIRSGEIVGDSTIVLNLGLQANKSVSVIMSFKTTRGLENLQRVINLCNNNSGA